MGDPRRRPGGDRAGLPRLRRHARRHALRGGGAMIWLSWRQQRTEALIAAAIVAALAAVLIPTGIQIASAYHHDGIASCSGAFQPGCDNAIAAFVQRFNAIGGLIDWATMIPGVIGVLLAAPFITQLENGTYRLDWTQSITRGRWVAGKLGLA